MAFKFPSEENITIHFLYKTALFTENGSEWHDSQMLTSISGLDWMLCANHVCEKGKRYF